MIPSHIIYRGQLRRVFGIQPAKHGGHRHFILKVRGDVLDAWLKESWVNHGAWGVRDARNGGGGTFDPRASGQAGYFAVYVRSDHCRLAELTEYQRTGKRGRPRIKRKVGRPSKR